MLNWSRSGATSESASFPASHAASLAATASSFAASASAASHSSASTHRSIEAAVTILLVRRWTSHVLRWTHWALTSWAWSTFSRWTVGSISTIHAAWRAHGLVSHHGSSSWLEIARVTSWFSSGRVVLVEWLASASSFRIHTHALSVIWSLGSWTVTTVAWSAAIIIRVPVWWHWVRSWRVHEKGMPIACSVIVV